MSKENEFILVTNALTKQYGNHKALNALSMHVPKGAIYGFVGKNGAGKTTLIRLITGLQMPTSGSYELYGRQSGEKDIAKSRRRVGAVVETPSIYQNMTARQNLIQQSILLGLPSYEGIDEILDLVGLSNTGKKKVKNFSLGMKQRLGIAVALIGSPDFLILDEPVNGLDPQGIVEIRELILKLNREKQITFVISSHILDELSKLASHYGFIDKGSIVKEISAKEMEAVCRKCLRLTVSDTASLARVLDDRQLAYTIISDTEADIYGDITITDLTLSLAQAGCTVQAMHEHDESLEAYYIGLVGGESNE